MFVHADIGAQCYIRWWVGWGGVGWDDNVHVTRDAQRTAMLIKPGLMPLVTAFAEYRRDRKWVFNQVTRFKLRKTTLGSHEKKEWTRLPKPTPRNPHIRGKKMHRHTLCLWEKRLMKRAFTGRPTVVGYFMPDHKFHWRSPYFVGAFCWHPPYACWQTSHVCWWKSTFSECSMSMFACEISDLLVKSAISLRNPNRCLLNPNLCWFKSPHSCVRLPEGINRESIDIPFISSHFKIPWNSQIVPFEKSGWYPHWHPQYIIVSPHFASPTSPCLRVFHGSERGLEAAWPPKNPRGKPVGETNE